MDKNDDENTQIWYDIHVHSWIFITKPGESEWVREWKKFNPIRREIIDTQINTV